MRKHFKTLCAVVLVLAMLPTAAFAATELGSWSDISAKLSTAGDYVLTNDINISTQMAIAASMNIDGNGHTITSTNVANAGFNHKSDFLKSTFKNITFSGVGRSETSGEPGLWLGRGDWDMENVTVSNFKLVSTKRAGFTLGCSGSDAGELTLRGESLITNNSRGIMIANDSSKYSDCSVTMYGGSIVDNITEDVSVKTGTFTLADDALQSTKTIGVFALSGGTLNLGGNSTIASLNKTGGTINITAPLTGGICTVSLPSYASGSVVAKLQSGVDESVLEHLALAAAAPNTCSLTLLGRNIVVLDSQTGLSGTPVVVDYSKTEGESRRIASGSLHAIDYKTPAKWLSDGILLNSIRGQAHQNEFDSNYEYLPGILDDLTYERISNDFSSAKLMVGLYYGFKPQYGSAWREAALENNGATWKAYIATLMDEAYTENKKPFSWIPWNEPDLQWSSRLATDFPIAFRYAYEAVKAYDAAALVQGPELSHYSFSELTTFLSYCKANNCVPDVLAWHELNNSRSDTEAHCKALREWLIENNIEPMPFAITEYQGTGYGTTDAQRSSQNTYNSGLCVSYISGMERAEQYGFAYGLKSAWGLVGGNSNFKSDLGQMADFANCNMPTGLWYVYNNYRSMSGMKVSSVSDYTKLESFATADASEKSRSSRVLIGNWKSEDVVASVELRNIPDYLIKNGKIHIEAEIIKETLATALYSTETVINTERAVTDGTCSVLLPLSGRDAAVIKLSAPFESAAGIDASSLEYTKSANITLSGTDILCAAGGSPSTYVDETRVAPAKTTTYAENGDKIDFKLDVAESGLYNITLTHRAAPDNGFMQLYLDEVSFATPTDMYASSESIFTKSYGNAYLTQGSHTLSFRLVGTGKNAASSGYNMTFGKVILSPVTSDANVTLSFDEGEESICLKSGSAPQYLPTPQKEGYTFDGWCDASENAFTKDSIITENTALHAKWSENGDCRVKVYVARGSADMDEKYIASGEALTVKLLSENEDYAPKVIANGEDVTASVIKTEDGFTLQSVIDADTTFFVTFDMPYNLETAYAHADNETIALENVYGDEFAFEYKITPFSLSDGNVGFCGSSNTPSGWNSYNVTIRIQPSGIMDARNGATYSAVNTVAYSANETYTISGVIDVKNKKYTAYVTDEEGTKTLLAKDYAFRSDSPTTDDIAKITVRGGSGVAAGLFAVRDFKTSYVTKIAACDKEAGTVTVNAQGAQTAKLLCAQYNASGTLTSAAVTEVSLEAGVNSVILDAAKSDNTTLFLWSGDKALQPLCGKYSEDER